MKLGEMTPSWNFCHLFTSVEMRASSRINKAHLSKLQLSFHNLRSGKFPFQNFILEMLIKGIYNRLPLVICLILDIDMALGSLSLPWEVKSNKSWTTIFAIGA